MFKLSLGALAVMSAAVAFLFWSNAGLKEDVTRKQEQIAQLEQSLAIKARVEKANRAALEAARKARERAEKAAEENAALREAIIRGDLNDVEGSIGDALRLLKQLNVCSPEDLLP